jgi:hypothetical protein
LLHVSVAENTAVLTQIEPGRIRIPLGPPELPQRIQVLFGGRTKPGNLESEKPADWAPRLADLPVRETHCRLRRAVSLERPPDIGNAVADEVEQQWQRVQELASLIAKAEETLKGRDPDEIMRWYTPWVRRWTAARGRLAQQQQISGMLPNRERIRLQVLEDEQDQIAERLGVIDLKREAERDSRLATQSLDVWRMADPGQTTAIRVTTASSGQGTGIKTSQTSPKSENQRLAAIAILIGLTAILGLFIPHPRIDWTLRRYPECGGILTGAIWWQFFALSWLGFVLFLTSLIALVIGTLLRLRHRRKASLSR